MKICQRPAGQQRTATVLQLEMAGQEQEIDGTKKVWHIPWYGLVELEYQSSLARSTLWRAVRRCEMRACWG